MVMTECCTMQQNTKHGLPQAMSDAMRPESIGRRMRLLRLAAGLSPSEMADGLGIERTYWSRFENGKRAVSDTVAALLVARYGITLDWLILGRWDKLPLDLAKELRQVDDQ